MKNIATMCSALEALRIILYFITGLLPFVKINTDFASSFYIFPRSSGNIKFL